MARIPPNVERFFAFSPKNEAPPNSISTGITIVSNIAANQDEKTGKSPNNARFSTTRNGVFGSAIKAANLPSP